ncbi:AgmX/PglI C-terminal domain-containing protein [Myxococcota bacterium]|jgi:TonB family protein|nr:AgmX/PglI C-terminal domain-containing protein [Myxococcota bacterium]
MSRRRPFLHSAGRPDRPGVSLTLTLLFAILLGACGAEKPRGERNVQYRIQHAESPDTRMADLHGHLADEEVRRVIEEQRAGFNNCFRQSPDAFISGNVELTFIVRETGRVADVFVSKSSLGALPAEDCLVQTARFLEFPAPHGGKARFAFPFEWNEPARRLSEPVPVDWGYAVLASNRERFERCRSKHDFQAPFNLLIYVGRLGTVLSAGFDSGLPPGNEFPSCVVDIVKGLRFPNPGNRIVRYRSLVEHLPDDLTPMNKDID